MLKSKAPQVAFWLVVLLMLGLQQGALLRMVYPLVAVCAGLWLESVSVAAYVSFVLWLWMFSPLVRRLADLQGGWQDPSLILLAPFLVTMWPIAKRLTRALLPLARLASSPAPGSALPIDGVLFLLAAIGVASGIPLGLASSLTATGMESLNWLVPVGFGWYIASRQSDAPDIERAVVRTLQAAALIIGAYGIYQFLVAPPWDVLWMVYGKLRSIGKPAPFEIRVFSTMHSPGVLGAFLLTALVLWVAKPRLWGLPAVALASVTLVLSQVRTAWVGFGVAALFVLLSLPFRVRFRVIALVAIVTLCVTPFLFSPDVSEMTTTRFASFMEPDDLSAVSRVEGHVVAFDYVLDNPLGGGLGFFDSRLQYLISINDSAIVATLLQFGLVGAFVYAMGLLLLFVKLWAYYRGAESPEALGLACAGLGLLSTASLGTVTSGVPGVLFWLIGGLAVAHGRRAPTRAASRVFPMRKVSDVQVRWVPATVWHSNE